MPQLDVTYALLAAFKLIKYRLLYHTLVYGNAQNRAIHTASIASNVQHGVGSVSAVVVAVAKRLGEN